MKIKMLRPFNGRVADHWDLKAGDKVEVSDAAGASLCAKGFAEPVASRKEASTAVAKKPETRG